MQQVITYSPKARLFSRFRDEDDLFYQLMEVDFVTLEHDLEMDGRVEGIVKNMFHLINEFVNYLHRPTVRYKDQILRRDLMMYLYRLKWRKLQLAGRIEVFTSDDAEIKIMQLVIIPIDHPIISVDRYEFDDEEAQAQVLYPLTTL